MEKMKIAIFRLVLVLSVVLVLNVQMMLASDAFAVLNLSSNEAGLKTICLESGNDDATSSNLGYVMLDGTTARLPCDLAVPYVYYGIHYFPENSSYTFVRWEPSSGIVIEDPSSRETVVVVNKSGIIRAVYAGPSPARVRGQEIEVGEHIFSTHNTSVGFVFNAQISFFNWSYPWIYSHQLKLWYDNALLEAINASIPEDHFLKPRLDPSNIIIIDPGTIDQDAGYVSFAASLRGSELGSNGSGILATIAFKILQVPSKNGTLSCCLRLQGVVLADPLANRVPSNLYALVNGSFLVEWKAKSTDVNGDGKVNIQDVTIVAVAYGSKLGDSKWNVVADLDDSGKIDIVDVVTVAKDYGKTV